MNHYELLIMKKKYFFREKHLDVEETEIAANYAAITAYNGPIRNNSLILISNSF